MPGPQCPACSSSFTSIRYPQFENPWWCCADCHLRFREHKPVERYESGACFTQAAFRHGDDFIAAYRRAFSEYLPYTKRPRLLEIGFGHGGYLTAAHELGFDVLGIDTSARNVKEVAARFGMPVRQATLEQAALAGSSFDTALLSHLIEHLPDPIATLREVARVLVPGGRLILITPNAGCYLEWIVRHRWPMYRPDDHIRLFTPASLRRALARAGFALTRLWTADSPADFPLGLASALLGPTLVRPTSHYFEEPDSPIPRWRYLAYRALPLFGYPFLLTRYLGVASCLKCVATRP